MEGGVEPTPPPTPLEGEGGEKVHSKEMVKAVFFFYERSFKLIRLL